MLDACLVNSNIRAGTIAHRLDGARVIFRDKIRDVCDRLPLALKEAIPVIKDLADELVFSNNSSIRVSTSMRSAWDIGVSDSTAIWCFQILHESVRIVGFLESSGEGLSFYLDKLQDMAIERRWKNGIHHLPADISVREWGTGKSRAEQMMMEVNKRRLGKRVARVPNISVDDGINATRQLLGRCTFDAGPCAEGLRAPEATARIGMRRWERGGIDRDTTATPTPPMPSDSLAVSYRD